MIAKMLCVKASLISTKLLSEEDKDDMLNGLISVDSLITHVRVWIENGMQDYVGRKWRG